MKKYNMYYYALKDIEEIYKSCVFYDPFSITKSRVLLKDCAILWNLVNLSIPHRPCACNKTIGKCYRCNNVVNISYNFCPNCGQALKWSDN